MEKEKNKNEVNILLILIIVVLTVLCILFATGTIKLNSKENIGKNNNQTSENTKIDLSNIIVTQNGKVISNEIPIDLVGKYVNPDSSDNDYFEILMKT